MRFIRLICLVALCSISFAQAVRADSETASEAYNKGDYATALEEWQALADKGNAPAQYALGLMYKKGLGVRQDYNEAVPWFWKAAEQGYSSAQSALGVMYTEGLGLLLDYVEAHKWFAIAAAQGNEGAKKNLASIAERMTPEQVGEAEKLAAAWKPCGKTTPCR
jgi:TPR repeat protein